MSGKSFQANYKAFESIICNSSELHHFWAYCNMSLWRHTAEFVVENYIISRKLELLIKLQKLSIYKGLMGCEQLLLVCWCIFKNDSICFVEATSKSPNKSKTVSFRNVSFSINSVVYRVPPIKKYSKFFLVVIWKEQ